MHNCETPPAKKLPALNANTNTLLLRSTQLLPPTPQRNQHNQTQWLTEELLVAVVSDPEAVIAAEDVAVVVAVAVERTRRR